MSTVMKDTRVAPYADFGKFIAAGRKRVGLALQSDLAAKLGCSQQSVSRWEAGRARARLNQLPAIAAVLQEDEAKLRQAAGYDAGMSRSAAVSVSFDRPFPIEALTPESFERFLDDLLHYLYRDAREVRRAGKTGHTQGGIDLLVVQADGTRFTFQCKRVVRFGPAEVLAAVRAQTEPATRKFLVLSRVASPQAAAALRAFEDWELWDSEDINRLIRQRLSGEEQIRLIDTYFPNQRFALLGVAAPAPWQTVDEFFAPFHGKLATFSHDWSLVGRATVADDIVRSLAQEDRCGVLLVAPGGVGKSRMLKQVADRLRAEQPARTVLFLSPTEPVTAAALDLLGRTSKVLIVDDAHDRGDLAALFAYAADVSRNTHLLIATRPYARVRILAQAAAFALGDGFQEIALHPLSLPETTELAAQVLDTFGISPDFAEPIARATRDCLLVTVMAARIAAKENLPLALAQDHDAFRNTILGKFAKVITGELGSPSEQKQITELLKVGALVQPFVVEDAAFRNLLAQTTKLDEDAIASTLRLLSEGGILFRRGAQYRLMPDLLGDYIIEQTCIAGDGRLTPFAERVFASAPHPLMGHVLVNLGRLDWRRSGGDSAKSHLLDQLWRELAVSGRHHDPALEAASSAAYYQPRHALEFVTRQIRSGMASDQLSSILKHVALNVEYVTEVCDLLWRIGRADNRELSRFPGHAIRTLCELCAVEPEKPIAFNEKVVAFGIGLLADPQAFGGAFTPFDFLEAILSGEGHTTSSTGRTLTMKAFKVRYEAVAALRAQVIDAAIALLQGVSTKAAVRAATFLEHALRYPMSILGLQITDEDRGVYTGEFLKTVATLKKLVKRGTLDPTVVIAIAHTISWHANYGPSETARAARAIMKALPTNLEFRVLAGLADGFGRIFIGHFEANTWQTRLNDWIATLATDLSNAYSEAPRLRQFLESCLERMAITGLSRDGSSHVLLLEVLRRRPDLAADVVEAALQGRPGQLGAYLGAALFHVLDKNRDQGRRWARRLLDSGDTGFQAAIGQAFSNPRVENGTLLAEDSEILVRVLASPHVPVVRSGLRGLGVLAREHPRLAIDLLKHANLALDGQLADEAFMLFHFDRGQAFATLTEDDVDHMLSQLAPLSKLNGYWVQTILAHLSFHFPERTCTFFLRRVERAAASDDSFSPMRPSNYGPLTQVPLRFRETEQFGVLLDAVWRWMTARDAGDWRFEHHAGHLFEAMFFPLDAALIGFLASKVAVAGKQDLRWMANVFSNAPPNFVFDQQSFVITFLEACDQAGEPARRKGVDALFRSAISGIRSGTPGEPFPRDLEAHSLANAALARLSRLSPAYELYDLIRQHAERDIEFARREAEFFDDA
jgi:transcriptional regulator with XRE-family HTH domain